MSYIQAIVLAIIEGITEFLPVSSTGHMAIASAFFETADSSFTKLFEIVVQFGAILSVVVLYWKKFIQFKRLDFYLKLFIAIIPALAFGAVFKKHIEQALEKPIFISSILFLGGIVLLFVDRWFKAPIIDDEEKVNYKTSFFIGFALATDSSEELSSELNTAILLKADFLTGWRVSVSDSEDDESSLPLP